jgi:hypothetical protein
MPLITAHEAAFLLGLVERLAFRKRCRLKRAGPVIYEERCVY